MASPTALPTCSGPALDLPAQKPCMQQCSLQRSLHAEPEALWSDDCTQGSRGPETLTSSQGSCYIWGSPEHSTPKLLPSIPCC